MVVVEGEVSGVGFQSSGDLPLSPVEVSVTSKSKINTVEESCVCRLDPCLYMLYPEFIESM